jgi:hypothetical protein
MSAGAVVGRSLMGSWSRGVALCMLVTACIAGAGGVAAAPGTPPATFTVGFATRTVAPLDQSMKTHFGGYGSCDGCGDTGGATAVRRDTNFTVRAMYVSDGKTANVVVSEPAEGWFAGYQEGPGLGILELRQEAATRLSAAGRVTVTPANLIVSTIHCHACPTLIGIWGPTNPVYLRYVYTQALAAILEAQASARPAHLSWATGDIGYINDVTVGQANANEGWPIDGQLSVLQARDATTGAVLGHYMTVPAHGNIVFGPDLKEMDDEYFGAASRWLERHVGGTSVVAAATLGDQTTPMQGDNYRIIGDPRGTPDAKAGYPEAYDVIDNLGALVGSTAVEALASHAHPVTDPALGSAETYELVPIDNPLLVGLNYGNQLPGTPATQKGVVLGTGTDDRSLLPPYLAGDAIGVWFTALRIGDVAIISEPGEAFPHVTQAIRNELTGAGMVAVVGNAQDQLGYYFEPWAYPGTFYYSADHYLFNASLTLAQQNIAAELVNGQTLGFAVSPTVSSYTDAGGSDYLRYFKGAGVQAWAYPRGDHANPAPSGGITVPIGIYSNSARGTQNGFPALPGAEVATGKPLLFVDGKAVPTTSVDGKRKDIQYGSYTFPCPGDYVITATLPGTSATWKSLAHVYSASMVTNTAFYPSGTGDHPLAMQNLREAPPACAAATASAPVATPRTLPNTVPGGPAWPLLAAGPALFHLVRRRILQAG